MLKPTIERAFLVAALLFPLTVHASFGGTSCKNDFWCLYSTLGLILGTVGVPVSAGIFAALHIVFCNPERSRPRQFVLGGGIGMVAYEISAVCGSLIVASGITAPVNEANYMLGGFALVYVALAIASVLYARSSPRPDPGEEGVDSP